ncbi:MAG TPA: hypothetical protein VEJ88_04895 [Dissulfurispiraceae bacterium]|nr:hypothetical protein [Dissulfurispiraceae bacterium]
MKKAELWVMLFIVGILGFNWPFLEIVHRGVAAYLFLFWLVFIILGALTGFRAF